MGLDCSHGAFSGAYSAFNRLRQIIAEADGGSFPPHYKYGPCGRLVELEDGTVERKSGLDEERVYFGRARDEDDGLYLFLAHSDCDGEFTPDQCLKVADALEALLPKIEALNWNAGGHIERDGGYVQVTKRFIQGCRDAHAANEPLRFF